MKNTSKQIDRQILKTLEPLNTLNPILLDELAAKSIIDEVPADRIICRHGEKDSRQIYLLSGEIEVVKPGETKTTIIKSKSAVKTPIAEGSPRNETLKTKTASTLLYIDADLLELLMSDEPELNTNYQVTEIEANDDDWMLTFLQSPAFLQLPTENIQKLLTHMEEIPVKKDQVIITQEDTDDNYYIVKSGSCNVHRQPYKGSANVLLAVLPTGSGFGEEALISNGSRNATITMRENGRLMRLKKKDFLTLLIKPLITYFESSETQNKINDGCVVIDVRSELDSKQKPLEGAVNIPLSMLRVKFDSLKSDREYLLVCNDGSQSAAAAFLMIQSGLKCSVLHGGLNNSKISSKAKSAATPANDKVKQQAAQITAQQEQIKAAREKAEQDIIKQKKELAESRARIAKKKQQVSSVKSETTQAKEKASQDLAKAKAESKAIELRQQETNKAAKHAEEMMKQSAAQAEQARKQAEKEAELIKQTAMKEAEHLRAEVEAARQKMVQDAVRIKEEEEIIKQAALKIKDEANEIRRRAMEEAQQARAEIEETRLLVEKKLQLTQDEEKRKHNAIIAQAKLQADKLSATKTQEAAAEANAIRQKAKEDATRLHHELEQTRKQIEAEAARVISELKEQTKQAEITEKNVQVIEEEIVVELVAEDIPAKANKKSAENVDYTTINIPGMSAIEPINNNEAKQKAEAIKAKLTEYADLDDDDDDLFDFNEPVVSHRTKAENSLTQIDIKQKDSVVIFPKQEQQTAHSNLFLDQDKPQQTSTMNYSSTPANQTPSSGKPQQFNKQAYMRKHQTSKSNTLAIAASFLMILAGAVFTLHATNTVKVQSIAALFNSGNDSVQSTALVKTKTIRKKVLRADTKVNVKKKVANKMDDIMTGWQNVLSEAENPKKNKK